jgi:uncharacterized protein (UPF0332 family)
MKFEWEDYLKLAHQLFDEHDIYLEESSYRTSISRAYYSVFNMAKNHLMNLGTELSNSGYIHKQIPLIFKDLSEKEDDTSKKKKLIRISNELSILRSTRNNADYDNEIIKLNNVAKAALIRADKLKETIHSI